MTLLEGYIALWKSYPKDEIKIRVARPSILAPSKELLDNYKSGRISWQEYKYRFEREIEYNPDALAKLNEIKELVKTETIRLICWERSYPCHRFILINMINRLGKSGLHYVNLIKFDASGYPSCEDHGAMTCVNKERSIYRCSQCHIGVSFDDMYVFDEWLRIQKGRVQMGIKRRGID